MTHHPPDVLIIGHGIAGPALALFLHRAGIRSEVCEARPAIAQDEGFFLYLAPNGMNVLAELGLADAVRRDAIHTSGMAFSNGRGRRIGAIDSRNDAEVYGSAGVVLKRAHLQRVLHDAVHDLGIPVHTGAKLDRIEQGSTSVDAHFVDGTTQSASILIGADGIHSRTRSIALSGGPAPSYVGLVDTAGFVTLPHLREAVGPQHMVFGRRAFFSYTVHPSGEVYWFSNVPVADEPARGDRERIGVEAWRDRLIDLHAGDPEPIREIITRTAPESIGTWPLHDLPTIPRWHAGRVCLVGDAAHATSPSSGQGASMALESAMVLAKSLRDEADHAGAFERYETQRRPRVEHVIAQGRRIGNHKVPGPVGSAFRDLLLPAFLRLGARDARRTYGHRIRWTDHARGEANRMQHRP